MFHIFSDIVSSLFWGVIFTLLLSVIVFYLPKMIAVRYGHTPLGILFLVVGFCFFAFQLTLLTGSFKLKGYIPSARQIEQLDIRATTLEEFGRELTEQYPMLEKYIRKIADNGGMIQKESATVADLVQFVRAKLYRMINNYIWRRVGWIIGGVLILGVYFVNDASRQTRIRRREIANDL
jgi:predicted PurR-regulated permease PerM